MRFSFKKYIVTKLIRIPVVIQHNVTHIAVETGMRGWYDYRRYSFVGRVYRASRKMLKLILIGVPFIFIPGEMYFYLTFLLVYLPYSFYRDSNLSVASESVTGDCPSCRNAIDIRLQEDDRLPFWKYCPLCEAALKIEAHDENFAER